MRERKTMWRMKEVRRRISLKEQLYIKIMVMRGKEPSK